jgi:hypothetical protein
MLGSWSEHSTPQEQIKNIIAGNSQPRNKRTGTAAAKNCT